MPARRSCTRRSSAPALGLDRLRGDTLSSLFYVANWRFVLSGQSYFAGFTTPSPLLHLWSLAVEEQFYLFWPPIVLAVLWFARRRLRLRAEGAITAVGVVALLGAIAPSVLMAALYVSGSDPSRGTTAPTRVRRRCSSAPSSRSSSRCTDPCGRSLRDKPCPSLPRSASWW